MNFIKVPASSDGRGFVVGFLLILLAAPFALVSPAKAAETNSAKAAPPDQPVLSLTPAQREKIHLTTITRSNFHRAVEATGTVAFDADQATTILAPVSGPVSHISAALGARVKAGDVLASVASPDFAAAISAYRKAVATARNTKRIAELTQQLSHNNLSRREVDQAQTDAANAEADRQAALEQLRALGVDGPTLEALQANRPVPDCVGIIRAPLEGTVVEKLITPGQLLQTGVTPCFTVADLSQVWVTANVFESDLGMIEEGDPADIFTSAWPTNLTGTVDYISAIVDPGTRAVGVRVVAKNPKGILKKQMYVRLLIHSRREQSGLLVPVSAVLRDDDDLPFVFLAKADGSYSRRRITLGTRVDDRYDVTEGLAPGDQVVVDGGLFLQFLQDQ